MAEDWGSAGVVTAEMWSTAKRQRDGKRRDSGQCKRGPGRCSRGRNGNVREIFPGPLVGHFGAITSIRPSRSTTMTPPLILLATSVKNSRLAVL